MIILSIYMGLTIPDRSFLFLVVLVGVSIAISVSRHVLDLGDVLVSAKFTETLSKGCTNISGCFFRRCWFMFPVLPTWYDHLQYLQ